MGSIISLIKMKNNSYKISSKIGCGQFGDIYLGTNQQYGSVAIKSTQKNTEYQNQLNLLSKMHHPNIVNFIQNIEQPSQVMIVMEYASNGDLSQYIKQRFPHEYVPEEIVRNWILQLSLALHYLHEEMKLIHRDLKLINILVSETQLLKLCDFGSAQEICLKGQEQRQNPVGTPYYLSPESIVLGKFSVKSDIWSLGCTLYEICTGHKPFTGKSLGQILKSITKDNYNQFPEQAQYSKWLISLIKSMLQKDPQKRPSTRSILQDQQLRKEFYHLKKNHQEYSKLVFPEIQVRTKKHVFLEEKLGENFHFANAMIKTAKKEISIKIPDLVGSKSEKQQIKKVQRLKFAKKSLFFILQKKQGCNQQSQLSKN